MTLDIHTLGVMTLLVAAQLSAGLAVATWPLPALPGLRPWMLGIVSIGVGTGMMVLRGRLSDGVIAFAGNGLLYLGVALAWAGARDYCARPRRVPLMVLGLFAMWLGMGWFYLAEPSPRMRLLIYSASALPWAAGSAWTLLRHGPPALRTSTRLGASIFALYAVFLLGRPFAVLPGTSGTDLLRPSGSLAAVYIAATALLIAWTLAVLAMTSHRLLDGLHRAARRDGLTGLLNRRALEELGKGALALCRRQGLPCAALLIDLDHFKRLNDTFGHAAGDAALRHFAALVSAQLRSSDLFGRYGGEEFCLLMPGAGRAQAALAADRVRALIESHPPRHDGRSLPLTVSIGVASHESPSDNGLEGLVFRADAALYEAKKGGRNRVHEACAHAG